MNSSVNKLLSRFESGFERRAGDHYCTEPRCTRVLLNAVALPHIIWEPACGKGDISEVLEEAGHTVMSTDLINHGYGAGGVDFLLDNASTHCRKPKAQGIVTNPPYGHQGRLAEDFIERGLDIIIPNAGVMCLLLRLAFLAGKSKKRRKIMHDCPQFGGVVLLPFRPYWDESWREGAPPAKASPFIDYFWGIWDARHRGGTTVEMGTL